MEALDKDLGLAELELLEPMSLNVGPAHPSMHGTCRIVMELSGETVIRCDVQIGYLHRGFEKMCERGDWTQVFPYVDRCNYVSPMLNNVGYALACEKMLEIEVPERCQWYRMALGELARIADGARSPSNRPRIGKRLNAGHWRKRMALDGLGEARAGSGVASRLSPVDLVDVIVHYAI